MKGASASLHAILRLLQILDHELTMSNSDFELKKTSQTADNNN
jgi:hypothetical protein